MSAGVDIAKVKELVAEPIGAAGLVLYDLAMTTERGRPVMRLLVERQEAEGPGTGVSVGECAELSHEISLLLDTHDPVAGAYILEVSSPGVERPLIKLGHYRSALGANVSIIIESPLPGAGNRNTVEGVLVQINEGDDGVALTVALQPPGKNWKKGQPRKIAPVEEWETVEVPLDHIRRARTLYELPQP